MNGNRRKRPFSYCKVAAHSLADCWRASPPLFAALIITATLLCAVQAGEAFAMRRLFDAACAYFQGNLSFDDAARAAIPMAALLLAFPVVNTGAWLGQGYFWRIGSGYFMARNHERAQRFPLIAYEKKETLERIKKARLGSEDAPAAARAAIQFTFYFIPYLLFTALFLIRVKPVLLVALAIMFASVMLAQFVRAGIIHQFASESAGLLRQSEYFESCVTGRETMKETRTLGATGYFFGLFLDAVKRYNRASMAAERKIARAELLLRGVNAAGYIAILALLIYFVVEGSVSAGAFASVFYSIERMNDLLKTTVDYFGDMIKEIGTAAFVYEQTDTPGEGGNRAPLEKNAEIRFEHVDFTYPGAAGKAPDDVSFTIRRGETLAVVGENGAGKTTLAKLLMGLYDPTSGTVRYGDADMRDYARESRFQRVSSVFQNFMRYKLTARENIAISDIGAPLDVLPIARQAGAQIDHLPGGPDTMLSREFDGIELSGGQWQRIAIARGLYRAHDLIVLDEPTAAIDPMEETNIFRLFKESVKGKTALLVTHRLGSAKIADRILLMDRGRIRELGTHEELMAKNGRYAQMYREQAGWYER